MARCTHNQIHSPERGGKSDHHSRRTESEAHESECTRRVALRLKGGDDRSSQNITDELLKFIESYVAKHSPKPKGRRKCNVPFYLVQIN